MFASRSVTRFAPDVERIVAFRFQARMGGGHEIPGDRLVAVPAGIAADVGGTRNGGRGHDGLGNGSAGNQQHCEQRGGAGK